MTKDRSRFDDLVFTDVAPEDNPWSQGARAQRRRAGKPRPVPSCVPDMSLGAKQWVYILCLGEPTSLKDGDFARLPGQPRKCVPVSHYVGWTGRPDPRRRITEHGGGLQHKVVAFLPDLTHRDETMIKVIGTCPSCDAPLNYFREAWDLHAHTLTDEQREELRPRAFPLGARD